MYKLIEWVPLEKLSWCHLSYNRYAISLLEKEPHRINQCVLSFNPNAIHFLKANQHRIDWLEPDEIDDYIKNLSMNPSIFRLDYEALEARCAIYKEELIQKACHPSKLAKILDYLEDNGINIDDLDNYW